MARQVLPIVGAIVGGYFGGPSGAQAGWALGSAIGGVVDPVVNKGPSLGDLPTQTSYEGSPRAITYGTATCSGYIMAFGEPIKSSETTGDKGGPETESEVVHRTYAIAICEGPIGGVLRVWENDTLVYDVRASSQIFKESEKWLTQGGGKKFYLGGESQLPDALLSVNVTGEDDTVGYSGTAYMCVIDEDLTDYRGAIPQYRFEVSKELNPVSQTLVKAQANRHIVGLDIGGMMSTLETTEGLLSSPGNVCLAVFGVNPLGALVPSDLYVLINGGVVWSKRITSPGTHKVQINQPPGVFIQMRFAGSGQLGNIGMHVWAVNSSEDAQTAIENELGDIPRYYDSTHENFGVTLNSAEQFRSMRCKPDFQDEIPWGPATFQTGFEGSSQSLSSIVEDLHRRSSVSPDDFDVSELGTTQVRGLTLQSDGYSAADAIGQLQGCYFFDKQEPGDKIYYPLRGKPVVATLTIDDLVEIPDTSRREQASEIPKKVNLMYQNAVAGYAPVKATFSSSSPDNRSVLEVTTQVAVVLDVDESARMVNKMFKVATADAQGEIKVSIPEKFARLVPGDSIGLVIRGRVMRLRIASMEWADGIISFTCKRDRQSAYTSNVTGIAIPPPVLPPSTLVGETEFAYLDMPTRIDSEDDLHYLVAGTGALDGWRGWALQRSTDVGANFATVDKWNDRAVVGALIDPLAAASEHYTDTTNKVRVRLFRSSHSIEDITEQQFLSEGGAFAIARTDGSAEVIQYLNADDEGDGVFLLSMLHRGLLNTRGAAHAVGATLVMMSSAKHVVAQSAWIGQSLTHRAISIGESAETAEAISHTYTGRSQIEWPVAELHAWRDSFGVVSASWVPRHRLGSDVSPIASSNFTGFRAVINDGVTIHTMQDTLATSFTLTYATVAEPATVTIYPINRITGPGPGVSVTV